MINSRHTFTGKVVSELYSGYKLDKTFSPIHIIGNNMDNGLPVLLIANHFSWWDGFIQYRLNKNVFDRKLHVMMLEEQLRKNMILNRCGCFSIQKNSRESIKSLDYCINLLSEKNNMVLLFPQGEIQSIYINYIRFQSGLNYIFKHIKNDIQLVMNVNLLDYFSEKKPALNIYYQYFDMQKEYDIHCVESVYNDFAEKCRQQQCIAGEKI